MEKTTEILPTETTPATKSTATGYELRGHELDSINSRRRVANPGSPDIYLIEVDTIRNTSTMYWIEEDKNGMLTIMSTTNW